MTDEPKTRTAFTKDERGLMNNWAIEPRMYVDQEEKRFGMTEYAEIVNGRLAMFGLTGVLLLEVVTGKGLLQILGF
ncbi:chlorophyll a/b-binding protein [Tumidithrix elongata RA019]|uniref:Chlorophyll a/b-binding protein n=1 Tax=Tumidithrix elongata BACA0141 TaxID=2716417 RepID=A0AAW9PZW0_9CYAN|nr:chlorophyll a/b-binding protein [Tumidithrix elongata RA019]